MIRRPLPLILALIVGILVLVIINLLIGSVRIPMIEVCRILIGDDSNEIWTNIRKQVESIEYGSVSITVHNGKIVQVDKNIKTRFEKK